MRKDGQRGQKSRAKQKYMEKRGFGKGEQYELDIACDVLHTRYIL